MASTSAARETSPETTRARRPSARISARRLLRGGAIVEVVQRHVGVRTREREGGGAPDPLLGARHQGDASLTPHAEAPARVAW